MLNTVYKSIKIIKIFRENLTKDMQDLYTKNYKTLMKYNKEHLNK